MIVPGALLRDHDGQQLRDRLAVRRMKGDGTAGAHEQGGRLRDAADAGVRTRESVAECGGAGLLAPPQRANDRRRIEPPGPADRRRRDLERMSPVAHVDVEQDLLRLQPGSDLRDVLAHPVVLSLWRPHCRSDRSGLHPPRFLEL
jgi:hypothetical protein